MRSPRIYCEGVPVRGGRNTFIVGCGAGLHSEIHILAYEDSISSLTTTLKYAALITQCIFQFVVDQDP